MIHTGESAASFSDLLRVHASPMRASALLRTPDEIRPIKHNDCIKITRNIRNAPETTLQKTSVCN